ncbi:MAG: V0D/AC39 family V-type ATPase subunit [Flavonifractor plautii]
MYAPVLRHLRPSRDGALPDFTLAEAALRTAYFSHLYRIVHRQYTGRTQKVLLRALGEQIDLLNIIHVLRLKTYFPQTEPETYLRVLFPFHYRLNPDFTRALCAAPGVDDVFALLRDSPTGTASTAWRWARWRSTTSGPSAASTSVSSPPCPLHLHRRGVPGAQGAGAECAD